MMSLMQDDLAILEKKYAMYILLAVDKNPMSTKTEIMRLEPGNEKTKFTRLQELIEFGLIEYKSGEQYNSMKLILTPAGQDLVIKIKKIRLSILKLEKNRILDESDE